MRITRLIAIALCTVLTLNNAKAFGQSNSAINEQIATLAEKSVTTNKIPGLAGAISDSRGLIGIGAAGVTKWGGTSPFTEKSLVHIGSCTKAMTSTLLSILVAEDLLSWNDKLVDVLPELKETIHSDYQRVTLWQLVTHRAGMPANAKNWWVFRDQEIHQRRISILKQTLSDPPAGEIGDYLYSNLGYMAAGCMAEQKTGETWESLIKSRLFTPLGMSSAGFGPPGEKGKTLQPWGHNRKMLVYWNPSQHDNAQALGPAGRVHCTLEDWAKFTALQLPKPPNQLLSFAQRKKLRTPTGDYAAGWIVTERGWGKGTVLTHSGSNTMWYATVWVAPKINRAYFAATNSKDSNSHGICDSLIAKMIGIDVGL